MGIFGEYEISEHMKYFCLKAFAIAVVSMKIPLPKIFAWLAIACRLVFISSVAFSERSILTVLYSFHSLSDYSYIKVPLSLLVWTVIR